MNPSEFFSSIPKIKKDFRHDLRNPDVHPNKDGFYQHKTNDDFRDWRNAILKGFVGLKNPAAEAGRLGPVAEAEQPIFANAAKEFKPLLTEEDKKNLGKERRVSSEKITKAFELLEVFRKQLNREPTGKFPELDKLDFTINVKEAAFEIRKQASEDYIQAQKARLNAKYQQAVNPVATGPINNRVQIFRGKYITDKNALTAKLNFDIETLNRSMSAALDVNKKELEEAQLAKKKWLSNLEKGEFDALLVLARNFVMDNTPATSEPEPVAVADPTPEPPGTDPASEPTVADSTSEPAAVADSTPEPASVDTGGPDDGEPDATSQGAMPPDATSPGAPSLDQVVPESAPVVEPVSPEPSPGISPEASIEPVLVQDLPYQAPVEEDAWKLNRERLEKLPPEGYAGNPDELPENYYLDGKGKIHFVNNEDPWNAGIKESELEVDKTISAYLFSMREHNRKNHGPECPISEIDKKDKEINQLESHTSFSDYTNGDRIDVLLAEKRRLCTVYKMKTINRKPPTVDTMYKTLLAGTERTERLVTRLFKKGNEDLLKSVLKAAFVESNLKVTNRDDNNGWRAVDFLIHRAYERGVILSDPNVIPVAPNPENNIIGVKARYLWLDDKKNIVSCLSRVDPPVTSNDLFSPILLTGENTDSAKKERKEAKEKADEVQRLALENADKVARKEAGLIAFDTLKSDNNYAGIAVLFADDSAARDDITKKILEAGDANTNLYNEVLHAAIWGDKLVDKNRTTNQHWQAAAFLIKTRWQKDKKFIPDPGADGQYLALTRDGNIVTFKCKLPVEPESVEDIGEYFVMTGKNKGGAAVTAEQAKPAAFIGPNGMEDKKVEKSPDKSADKDPYP